MLLESGPTEAMTTTPNHHRIPLCFAQKLKKSPGTFPLQNNNLDSFRPRFCPGYKIRD